MNTIKDHRVKLCTFRTLNVELTIAYESMIENGVDTVTKYIVKYVKSTNQSLRNTNK